MTPIRILITASLLCSLPPVTAFAQADRSGNGGGPLSTERASSTTAVGQTKPPRRDAGPTSVKPVERRTGIEKRDDAVDEGICIGCGRTPGSTGSLSLGVRPTTAPDKHDAELDELRAGPVPKQQSDLDTVALASAHRERARSVEEKTNGLWQSWLVSVCEGCGDQRPASGLTGDDFPPRTVPATTGSTESRTSVESTGSPGGKVAVAHHHGSLEGDLSPENVDAIRRMPRK